MDSWTELALAILLGPLLWLAGAIFFDAVHALLHALLRSPWALLRGLARPHAVHHEWIDRQLRVNWERQRANILCHLLPEYLTQLVFTAGVALLLPFSFAVVLGLLQTGIFLYLLSQGGHDINHRAVPILDAYRPGLLTPPAYHALHHVHPDAHYSSYTKVVDLLLGSAAQLRGRRFGLVAARTRLGRALADELASCGVSTPESLEAPDPERLAELDVLVVLDPGRPWVAFVEAFVQATQGRQLPPEVWAVHHRPDDPQARYYHRDVRVSYRHVVLPEPPTDADAARRAARRIVSRVRRGFHYLPVGPGAARGWLRFRRTPPLAPAAAVRLRHRSELLGAL